MVVKLVLSREDEKELMYVGLYLKPPASPWLLHGLICRTFNTSACNLHCQITCTWNQTPNQFPVPFTVWEIDLL